MTPSSNSPRVVVQSCCCLALLLVVLIGNSLSFGASTFDAAMNAYQNKDYFKAAELFLVEANRGNAVAQNNLGVMYEKGEGVPQDDKVAVVWFRLAAGQGNALAQFNLGTHYARGYGVPMDGQEALRWYRLAAGQGNVLAQRNLGLNYLYGEDEPQDFIKAYAWLTVAETSGDEAAGRIIDVFIKKMKPSELYIAQKLSAAYYARIRRHLGVDIQKKMQ